MAFFSHRCWLVPIFFGPKRCLTLRIKALSENAGASAEFSWAEVLAILREYYASIKEEDKVEVKLSGHSAKLVF